jgi:AAT family amino acid transporter
MLSGIVVLALFDPASRTQLMATTGLIIAIAALNALAQRRSRRIEATTAHGGNPGDAAAASFKEDQNA